MADQKLTELDEITSLSGDELFYLADDVATTPISKGIQYANILKSFGLLTPVVVPDPTGFSWINEGDATVTTANGFWTLYDPANAGEDNHWYVRAIPTSPWTFTALISSTPLATINQFGIGMIDSATNKQSFISHMYYSSNPLMVYVGYCAANNGSGGADYSTPTFRLCSVPFWIQLRDNNTNWYYEYSHDGINFKTIYSQARNTSYTPDRIGFRIASRGGGLHYGNVLSLNVVGS